MTTTTRDPHTSREGGTCNAGNFDSRSQQVERYEVPDGTVLGVIPRGLASKVLRTLRSDGEVVFGRPLNLPEVDFTVTSIEPLAVVHFLLGEYKAS